MEIEFSDVLAAYRKAKVDVFYEKDVNLALEFARYEVDLEDNLRRLRERIIARDWANDSAILGDYEFVPKSVDCDSASPLNVATTLFSDPARGWRLFCRDFRRANEKRPEAEFRVISHSSVDWHVISALWILRTGHRYDAALSKSVRGARLKRRRADSERNSGFNDEALGCFEPYAPAYIGWRSDGLRAIQEHLEDGRELVAITADLKRFYHSVCPDFFLTDQFQDLCSISARRRADPLTADLITSLKIWAEKAPDGSNGSTRCGLPIGLGAARIIANCVLLEFDRAIEALSPIYYGRYVDDIFLVFENGEKLTEATEAWNYLIKKTAGVLKRAERAPGEVRVSLSYDPHSKLAFTGPKQKVFFLSGATGKTLVHAIDAQVRSNTSEWRHLPEISHDELDFAPDFLVPGRHSADSADNLRKSDGITLRRLQFAFRLRDLEAFSEDLTPSQWENDRNRFFNSVSTHVFGLPNFFTFATYVPRMLGLAVCANDWSNALRVVRGIAQVFDEIEQTCRYDDVHLAGCRKTFVHKLYVTLCKSVRLEGSDKAFGKKAKPLLRELEVLWSPNETGLTPEKVIADFKSLYLADLAREPYRWGLLDNVTPPRTHRLPAEGRIQSDERIERIKDVWRAVIKRSGRVPMAFCFPTRPLSPPEVAFLARPALKDPATLFRCMRRWMQALRGISFFQSTADWDAQIEAWSGEQTDNLSSKPPRRRPPEPPLDETGPDWWVPDAPALPETRKIRVCLPCLQVSDESWTASVWGGPDPDGARYMRTARLINDVLRCRREIRPHYVVLPELSLKPRWFWRFANKLSASKISLISGIEYQRVGKKRVVNQVRASLVTRSPGYWTFLVYAQNKTRPAPAERNELRRIAGVSLVPNGRDAKLVIRHGEFQFGILICSELTNIEYRARFRGRVDALFVPEWNRDIDGFSPLIESAATDLHLFAVQSNNRLYGDCRIRAPYKDEVWKRDGLRIKGGLNDYFAIGEIDFEELRRFQSNAESPPKPFKPVPDGFTIDPSRRMTPIGYPE